MLPRLEKAGIAYITTREPGGVTIAEKIQAGSVQINGRTERGPDHFPFIGTKGSGMGTQGVRRSIESMTREKVTVININ